MAIISVNLVSQRQLGIEESWTVNSDKKISSSFLQFEDCEEVEFQIIFPLV